MFFLGWKLSTCQRTAGGLISRSELPSLAIKWSLTVPIDVHVSTAVTVGLWADRCGRLSADTLCVCVTNTDLLTCNHSHLLTLCFSRGCSNLQWSTLKSLKQRYPKCINLFLICVSFLAAGVRQRREQASVEMMERDVAVTTASLQ